MKKDIIAGMILIILSIPAAAINSVLGLVLIVIGVYIIVRARKLKKQNEAKKAEETSSSIKVSSQSIGKAKSAKSKNGKTLKFKVAGVYYRTEEVVSLLTENPDYKLKKSEIIDSGMEDERIYEYEVEQFAVEFKPEPNNEYDPNAIAVYADGTHIGYVPRDLTSRIKVLVESGKIAEATCEIYGGKYKLYNSDEEVMEKEDGGFAAMVTLFLKD